MKTADGHPPSANRVAIARRAFALNKKMSGLGCGGTGALKVDGKVVATQKIDRTVPLVLQSDETFDIGGRRHPGGRQG